MEGFSPKELYLNLDKLCDDVLFILAEQGRLVSQLLVEQREGLRSPESIYGDKVAFAETIREGILEFEALIDHFYTETGLLHIRLYEQLFLIRIYEEEFEQCLSS